MQVISSNLNRLCTYDKLCIRTKFFFFLQVHACVTVRDAKHTNFVEFRNYKIVYRRYAGLYFCMCVDVEENNLMCLEAIHNFVEVKFMTHLYLNLYVHILWYIFVSQNIPHGYNSAVSIQKHVYIPLCDWFSVKVLRFVIIVSSIVIYERTLIKTDNL